MARKPYWELLRDPRWQRLRLEVMEEADFACAQCDAKDKTLNVHHRIYRKNADPWDYELSELQCLCEDCHEKEHALRKRIAESMAQMDFADLMVLAGYARGLVNRFDNEAIKVVDGEYAVGLGAYFGIGYVGAMELMKKDGTILVDDVVARLKL